MLGKRENESGGQPGARGGGLGFALKNPGVGRGTAAVAQAHARAVAESRGGEDDTDKRARAVSGWAQAQAHGNGWRGCWAERPRRAAGPVVGGPSGEKGRGASGLKTRKEGEKRKRILFLFIFQTNFPKAFSNNF